MNMNHTIYVQIASYRDPELLPTISDCLKKAKDPDRLRFGICFQHDENENLDEFSRDERFRIIDLDWRRSRGIGWARHELQKLYQGEKYTLQLDSHHRFSENWDEQLIEMMAQTGVAKPIITTHAPYFDPEQWCAGGAGPAEKEINPCKIVADSFGGEGFLQLKSAPINNWQTLLKPLRARFLSCHFLFTAGEFCLECQYDPLLYFSGQDINMTVRSFTAGYDLFHPHKAVVWHEYIRNGKPKHWDDHTDTLVLENKIDVAWSQRSVESNNRTGQLLHLFDCGIDLGSYGSGGERTIEEYEKYAGIDFENQRLHRDALDGKEPPVAYRNPENWRAEFFDSRAASRKREEYLELFNKGGINFPAAGTLAKPAYGHLSPGCQTCVAGTWSCVFITDACTRRCFYCPTPQGTKDSNSSVKSHDLFNFNSVDDYITYLKMFDYEGVSFSGGEPFLVVDRILEYITRIREVFGEQHYIWVYTNGDLVNDENLSLLQRAGLNEIRFDISANNYDLSGVKKAVEHIQTVTVEIPTIPEDTQRLKELLPDMAAIGLKHLNLHQLMRTRHNGEKLDQRSYTTVNREIFTDFVPIVESELAAYEILKYATETNLDLGINYCSVCYKSRFQGAGHKKRAATFFKDKKSHLTATGYLSQLAIDASCEEAVFIKNNLAEDEWEISSSGEKSELLFSVEHLDLLLKESYPSADVIYFEAMQRSFEQGESPANCTQITVTDKVVVEKCLKSRFTLENNTSAFLFYRLFLERKSVREVATELVDLYQLTGDDGGKIICDVNTLYERFVLYEYQPIGLEPYQ